jgi:uncharacterized membrane protein
MGFALILLTLGIYLLVRIFHLEEPIAGIGREFSAGLRSGKVSLFANLLALLIGIGAIIGAYNHVVSNFPMGQGECVIIFIDDVLWWFIGAVMISAAGKFADVYIREKKVLWSYSILPFSLIAFGLILSAALDLLERLLGTNPVATVFTTKFFIQVVIGVIVALIGMISHRRLEEFFGTSTSE